MRRRLGLVLRLLGVASLAIWAVVYLATWVSPCNESYAVSGSAFYSSQHGTEVRRACFVRWQTEPGTIALLNVRGLFNSDDVWAINTAPRPGSRQYEMISGRNHIDEWSEAAARTTGPGFLLVRERNAIRSSLLVRIALLWLLPPCVLLALPGIRRWAKRRKTQPELADAGRLDDTSLNASGVCSYARPDTAVPKSIAVRSGRAALNIVTFIVWFLIGCSYLSPTMRAMSSVEVISDSEARERLWVWGWERGRAAVSCRTEILNSADPDLHFSLETAASGSMSNAGYMPDDPVMYANAKPVLSFLGFALHRSARGEWWALTLPLNWPGAILLTLVVYLNRHRFR